MTLTAMPPMIGKEEMNKTRPIGDSATFTNKSQR